MSSVTVPRRWSDFALFAIFLALAVGSYGVTASFPSPLLPGYPGSAMFPRLILVAMGVICLFGLARMLIARSAGAGADLTIPLGPFAGVVGVARRYALLLLLAGAEIAIFCLITGCLWFRTRRLLVPVLVGLAAVVVVYLVFVQALSVHLPLRFLPRYLFLSL